MQITGTQFTFKSPNTSYVRKILSTWWKFEEKINNSVILKKKPYLQVIGEIAEDNFFFSLFFFIALNAQIHTHNEHPQKTTFKCIP